MSLKDKNLLPVARNPYGVEVKAFYYEDVKKAAVEFEKELNEFKLDFDDNLLINRIEEIHKKIFGNFEK